tara:strand:+ start:677 stop:1123 length:447 start_codon:yes stop_codon:yes gene_type:complete
MDKEKMVLYLGYFALVLIGIYFTFGFLKISGEGLASLGYENNYIIEGMTDKNQEKRLENFDKNIDKFLKKRQKDLDKLNEEIDIDEYKEKLEELQGIEKEILKKTFYSLIVTSKDFNPNDVVGSLQMAATAAPLGATTFLSEESSSIV